MDWELVKIDSLRRLSCQYLMIGLNSYWNEAAMSNHAIDIIKILELIRKVKDNTNIILNICQCNSEYTSRLEVERRGMKRAKTHSIEAKRTRRSGD